MRKKRRGGKHLEGGWGKVLVAVINHIISYIGKAGSCRTARRQDGELHSGENNCLDIFK